MNQIAIPSPQQPSEAQSLIAVISQAAKDPSVDLVKMQGLMELYERIEAKRSETAFNASMSVAQTAMRPIQADMTNPQTRSLYASYAKLDSKLRPIYTSNGFALSFDTATADVPEYIRVLCYVTHKDGGSRTYRVDMPADGKGAKGGDVMTKTHATGAGVTYGMRYLLKMIFNVAVGEDDNDGNVPTPEEVAAKRQQEHDDALGRHQESVDYIKQCIDRGDWQAMTSEWAAIPESDQLALWLAYTKGGIFTTAERAAIKEKQVRNPVSQAEGS
jgi:hypothetical protein